MKKYVVVASLELNNRIILFSTSLSLCFDVSEVEPIIISMGDSVPSDFKHLKTLLPNLKIVNGPSARVNYLTVMKVKRDIVEKFCEDGSILCLWDDDYLLSPYIFRWLDGLFRVEEVEYAAPIWTGGKGEIEQIRIDDLPVYLRTSAMGGGMCVRSDVFKEDFDEYYDLEDRDLMFDQGFWKLVRTKRIPFPVYTSGGFSLMQHIHYGSYYKKEFSHMEGINFSMSSPWEIFG